MYATDTILMFGFPLGTLCGARLRLSFLFPVVALAFMWRLQDPGLGMLACCILLFSVLMHELSHLLVARASGGDMDEIHLWPLGGLAEPYGRGYLRDHARTLAAGPLVNLLMAASCTLTLSPEEWRPLLNVFNGFSVSTGEHPVTTACRMAFFVNVILFSVNLLPLTPFDGGTWLRTWLNTRFSEAESRDLMVRLGLVLGILGILAGFVFDRSSLTAIGAFVVVLQIHESLRWYELLSSPDDFADYDFSERDTEDRHPENLIRNDSLDSSEADVLGRWQQQTDHERRERETEQREREERQVDEILQKLHLHGRESLSSREIHVLNEVSNRYRNRQRH